MSFWESVNPDQLAIIAIVAALLLSDKRSSGELNVLGNLIVAIGSIILTIAAQEEFQINQQNEPHHNENINQQIEQLQQQVAELYKKLPVTDK